MKKTEIDELREILSAGTFTVRAFEFDGSSSEDPSQGRFSIAVLLPSGQEMNLHCLRIRNLEICTGPFAPFRIAGLFLEDMSDAQWPGVNLRVASEDDSTKIAILCEDLRYSSDSDTASDLS